MERKALDSCEKRGKGKTTQTKSWGLDILPAKSKCLQRNETGGESPLRYLHSGPWELLIKIYFAEGRNSVVKMSLASNSSSSNPSSTSCSIRSFQRSSVI